MHCCLQGLFRGLARAVLLSGACFFGTLLHVGEASAEDGFAFLPAVPGPLWPTTGGSPYSLGQVPVPPYFALHPPVYYSVPVPRTYGYSPHAYPGSTATPEVVQAANLIVNPHVDAPALRSAPTRRSMQPEQHLERQVGLPMVIDNPHVRADLRAALRQAGGPRASVRMLP